MAKVKKQNLKKKAKGKAGATPAKGAASGASAGGLVTNKKFGQHLLRNPGIVDKILNAAELKPSDVAFEIGPGTGNLTVKLIESCKRVIACEIDPRMAAEVRKRCSGTGRTNLEVRECDVLKETWPIFDVCVANLPYQISSPFTFKLLAHRPAFRCAVLMFQKEFAERLIAKVGESQYGRLAVNTSLFVKVSCVCKVGRMNFTPPPEVDSMVVKVMRTPLQILFLILVTDLPPSIALGMEPGEANILKMRPRPKEEPIVLMWMWLAMIMTGAVLTIVVVAVYLISLVNYCDGEILQENIYLLDSYTERLSKAQTVAFISLVWSENIRAYISRSFTNPMWHDILGNKHMQKAIVMAQICLYVAVLTPYLSDRILGLRGLEIGFFGWVLALAGPVGCFILSESCKLISAYQAKKHQDSLSMADTPPAAAPIKVVGSKNAKMAAPVPVQPVKKGWFQCCMGGIF